MDSPMQKFIKKLEKQGKLVRIRKPVSTQFDAAGILKELDGQPVLFEKVEGSAFPVVGNLFSTRELVADYLSIKKEEIVPKLMLSIDSPSPPQLADKSQAPCLEVTEKEVDLGKLPILFHTAGDGGKYISSGVMFANDPQYGRNLSFHRAMVIGKNRLVLRILPRHLNEFIKRAGGKLKVAFCIGLPVNILLAGATSVEIGQDELTFANTLEPVQTVRLESGIEVPAETEFILEGTIDANELAAEGKFVDLTETYDVIRQQPVFTVEKIHHRRGAVYHALVPGCLEHKVLMGMPKEPTIWRSVDKIAKCTGVNITPGGCSWLHAVIQIAKKNEGEGKQAIEAAFQGHKSLKLAIIVDTDIDLYNPQDVEWALATRFQAHKDLIIKEHEKGSSLDPSADPMTYETTKWGIDATKPLIAHGKEFKRAEWKKVDLKKYLE